MENFHHGAPALRLDDHLVARVARDARLHNHELSGLNTRSHAVALDAKGVSVGSLRWVAHVPITMAGGVFDLDVVTVTAAPRCAHNRDSRHGNADRLGGLEGSIGGYVPCRKFLGEARAELFNGYSQSL